MALTPDLRSRSRDALHTSRRPYEVQPPPRLFLAVTQHYPSPSMPPKRARRASPNHSGLSAGERLKRTKLTGNAAYSAWGWVGTEVTDASEITDQHRMATCGFSRSSTYPLCPNAYSENRKLPSTKEESPQTKQPDSSAQAGTADDVIVISDDEGPKCSHKMCKHNPYCLNYLGQDIWEDAGEPRLELIVGLDTT